MQRFIPDIIDKDRRLNILNHIKGLGYKNYYCAKPVKEFLYEFRKRASDIFDKDLVPTYGYTRHYQSGEYLHKHTDRASCQHSFTICLDTNVEWPIHIDLKSGETVSHVTLAGEGVAYYGITEPHWRDAIEVEGAYQWQMFLHYVDTRGPYAKKHAYDAHFLSVAKNLNSREYKEKQEKYENSLRIKK